MNGGGVNWSWISFEWIKIEYGWIVEWGFEMNFEESALNDMRGYWSWIEVEQGMNSWID